MLFKAPVYERLETLIPEIIEKAKNQKFERKTAIQKILANPGIIPVLVDIPLGGSRVFWVDVGDYRFVEWKFRNSVAKATSSRREVEAFTTDISFLASDSIFDQVIYPTGFIFQMSRCGSTLLGKTLARSKYNLVLNEPSSLHEGFWQVFTDNWNRNCKITNEKIRIIRNLILAMGRVRYAEQKRYFIKFRSWNAVFFDLIKRAFPDVPSLFLYRDPTEVLRSAHRIEPFAYTRFQGTDAGDFILQVASGETAKMNCQDYCSKIYESIFSAILNSHNDNIIYLNYYLLTPGNFRYIIEQGFRYLPSITELKIMLDQFNYYSKDDSKISQNIDKQNLEEEGFVDRFHYKANPRVKDLYEKLETSEKNFKAIFFNE